MSESVVSSTASNAPGLRVLDLPDPQVLARLGLPSVPVFITTSRYYNGALNVSLEVHNYEALEGSPLEAVGPVFAVLSVNLDESKVLPSRQFYFKTWSENEGLLQQMEKMGVIRVINSKAIKINQWGSTAALVELLLSDQEIISHADDGASEYDEDEEDEEQEEEDDEEDDYYDVEGQEEDEESPNIAALDIGSGSNADPTGSSMITIVELPHNSFRSFLGPIDRKVTVQRARELLAHAGRADCPICAKLGFPLMLVPVDEGPSTKVIPSVGGALLSTDPRNNRFATVMASKVETGLAPGIAVGNVYAVRTDCQPFTVAEWARLDDVGLNCVMDIWGDGRSPSAAQYNRIKQTIMANIRHT